MPNQHANRATNDEPSQRQDDALAADGGRVECLPAVSVVEVDVCGRAGAVHAGEAGREGCDEVKGEGWHFGLLGCGLREGWWEAAGMR